MRTTGDAPDEAYWDVSSLADKTVRLSHRLGSGVESVQAERGALTPRDIQWLVLSTFLFVVGVRISPTRRWSSLCVLAILGLLMAFIGQLHGQGHIGQLPATIERHSLGQLVASWRFGTGGGIVWAVHYSSGSATVIRYQPADRRLVCRDVHRLTRLGPFGKSICERCLHAVHSRHMQRRSCRIAT